MILLQLFLRFLVIGALSFGGGYAVLPLVQSQCVELTGWLTMTEFSDLVTISQITPGPIAIDAAAFVGMKMAGVPGALVASFAFMLPPFIIVTILFVLYKKFGRFRLMQDIMSGLKPAVVGLVASAALGLIVEAVWPGVLSLGAVDVFGAVLFLACFVILRLKKTPIIPTLLTCGALGVIQYAVQTYVFGL